MTTEIDLILTGSKYQKKLSLLQARVVIFTLTLIVWISFIAQVWKYRSKIMHFDIHIWNFTQRIIHALKNSCRHSLRCTSDQLLLPAKRIDSDKNNPLHTTGNHRTQKRPPIDGSTTWHWR